MKKAIISRKMAIVLITLFTLGFTQDLRAQENTEQKPAVLKFAGKTLDHPVFELNLNNEKPDEFYITIKDDKSYLFYSGWLKGTNAAERYRLDMDDEDLKNVVFKITSKKTKQELVYRINKSTRMVEEVLVAKL